MNEYGELLIYNSKLGTLIALEDKEDIKLYNDLKNRKDIIFESELVKELYDNGYIVRNENMTEVFNNLIEKRNESDTLFISLLPTEDCNFRCVYCFEHFKRGAMSHEVQEGTINFIKDLLNRFEYKNLHINWYGGEPLYSFKVIENISEELIGYCNKNAIEYSSSITTNGYLLNNKIFKKLLSYEVRHYTVTLDGVSEKHNQTRVLKNGGPTFEVILNNLQNMSLSDENFLIQIRQNYSDDAFNDLDEFLKFYIDNFSEDKRFDDVDIRPIFNNGGYNDGNFDECISKQNKFRGLELASTYNLYNKKLKHYIQPGGIVCNASDPNYWMVGSDGKLMRCNIELDTEDRNVVGQISKNDYYIDFEKLAKWLDAGKNDIKCQSCFFSPNCQGAYCAKKRFDNERNNIDQQPCPQEKFNLSNILKLVYKEMVINE